MATELLGFSELSATQSNKFLTVNANSRQLEVFLTGVLDRDVGAVPGAPSNGDAYIIDVTTGDWSAFTLNNIAHYYGGTWYEYTPTEGARLWVADEDIEVVYNGTAWVNSVATGLGVAGMTDDSVPYVASGVLAEDINFNYDPGTDTLNAPNATITNVLTASTGTFSSDVTIGGSSALVNSDIGVTVQAYDADTTKNDLSNTFTQPQVFPAGTAALPSFTTAGDLNTGVFFPGADTVGIATAGSEAMRIDSSGNVGVGTTNPLSRLTINPSGGSSAASLELKIGSTNADSVRLEAGGTVNTWLEYRGYLGHQWIVNTTEAMRIDSSGNVGVGGTTSGASAAKALHLFNGTAPTGSVTDGVILYSEDVSSSAELKVRDEAGNVTTLSPHNFSLIPDGPSEELAWSYYSEKNGKKINVDMLKLARLLENLTGEKLVYTDGE